MSDANRSCAGRQSASPRGAVRAVVALALLAASPLPAAPPTNTPPPQPPGPRATPEPPTDELLDRPISFASDGTLTLRAALARLAVASGVRVEADWKALGEIGVEPTVVVGRFKVSGVPARHIARLLLVSVGADDLGVVTEAEADAGAGWLNVRRWEDRVAVTRSYPVGDLLTVLDGEMWEDDEDELVQLIYASVDPDTWRDNGGSLGEARVRGNTLIVTQTADHQTDLAALLAKLRVAIAGKPPPSGAAAAAVVAAADRPVDVRLDGLSWRDAFQRIADATGVNLFVHDRELEAAGIDLAAPAALPRGRPTLKRAADAFPRNDGPAIHLVPHEGILWMTSADAAGSRRFVDVRCHDVRRHLARLRGDPLVRQRGRKADEELVARMIESIQPDSWVDNGGSVGWARRFGPNVLVVSQTIENHRRVAELLDRIVAR